MPAVRPAARTVPSIDYPPALPVAERREDIAAAIRAHPVLVIAGDTGSGKTTQLPKICLELGRGRVRRIGHTQPRRIAARAVAQRIAEETGTPLGELIGYQVRFHEAVSEATAVKIMTDGILLNEMQRDRELRQYDTLIIDEAHERSLNIDFILGYLKRLLPRRADLKLIITSATIDVERLARYFDGAPIIEVAGRRYPVRTEYLARAPGDDEDPAAQVARTVFEVRDGVHGDPGDMLAFLATERDIRDAARRLRGADGLQVRPLYARLNQAEQARVFARQRRPGLRVVLATNVAETSVTVPGIRYVIDPGQARIGRYSYRRRIQRLPIEAVSRASADQRRGRCGRVGPGVCLRLYSEEDYRARAAFTDPEIQRSNLAAVVLRMQHLGLGDVEQFPFIDPPDGRRVRDGYRLLEELGALDSRRLTPLGRRMAAFPVDPSLARMVLAAQDYGVLPELLVLASALAIQDPREWPAEQRSGAEQSHARFRDPRSDFVSLLKLWRYYEERRQALSENCLRRLCQREYLSWSRLREWRDLHRQLTIACRGQGLRPAADLGETLDYRGVHRALLAGLLGNIARQEERREYQAARNRRLQLFPGSALYRKPPRWLLAGEIVETRQVYARTAASIDPRWVLDINPALLKHHYSEARWQPSKGRVLARRRTTLFGLTVADRVSVAYAQVDPELCRTLLIREGLLSGRWPRPPAFLKHNLRLQREVEDLESRLRRRDLLIDEEALFRFYDERLPARITNAAALAHWLAADRGRDAALRLQRRQLLTRDPGALQGQFPDRLRWDGQDYRLSYRFSPGGEADGVSVTVPVALLNRLPRHRPDWLVPGLLRDKCIALVRALPRALRKRLVPAPDWVDRALAHMQPGDEPVSLALGAALREVGGPRIDPEIWQTVEVDDYYRMNVRLVDERGRLLAQDRDGQKLAQRYRQRAPSAGTEYGQTGLTRWAFETLALEHRFRQAGVEILAYPALLDRGDCVDLTLCDYPGEAWASHRLGVARLLMLDAKPLFRDLRRRLLRDNRPILHLATLGLCRETLLDELLPALALAAADVDREARAFCRDKNAFDKARQQVARRAASLAGEAASILELTLQRMADSERIARRHGDAFAAARQDLRDQRRALLAGGALLRMPWGDLRHLARYAQAMRVRAERLAANYRRDQEYQAQVQGLAEPLAAILREQPQAALLSPSLGRYQSMLQEFRVSLFAQHLGTAQPVSAKRLRAQWESVQRWMARTGGRDREDAQGR